MNRLAYKLGGKLDYWLGLGLGLGLEILFGLGDPNNPGLGLRSAKKKHERGNYFFQYFSC